jgi:hypothetical protein
MITIHKIYNYAKNILIMLFDALRCETIRIIWVFGKYETYKFLHIYYFFSYLSCKKNQS